MQTLTLNDGRTMPQLGMGTYQLPDSQAAMVVRQGIDAGFRLVDTAAVYDTDRGGGRGAAGADVFLTTKLWNDRHADPAAALDESLALLGVDAVDLFLIHWPVPGHDRYVDAWKKLIELRDEGKARSIGVSNFLPHHLDRIINATGVTPAVNQIELHPDFQQRAQRAYHDERGIVTQSWSPIGQGKTLLDNGTIVRIASKYSRSPAQVIIAWHLAHGLSVIPKASSPEHLRDNFASQGVVLDEEDMAAIDALDSDDGRIGPHPEEM